MVKLVTLEYWHSFRPPRQTSLFVNPREVVSIRELPFDERRCETLSEVTMNNGEKFLVEGSSDDIAIKLASDAITEELQPDTE